LNSPQHLKKRMFHLRDALTGSGFSDRANDVFSALGSGSVKQPDISYNKDHSKSNFDDHQLERSIRQTDKPTSNSNDSKLSEYNAYKQDTGRTQSTPASDAFKHPAEHLRPKHNDKRRQQHNNRRHVGERGGGGTARRGRLVPDFKKNPGNWTKYSLADADDVTDRSNTAAAMQFLHSLRKDNMEEDEDCPSAAQNDGPGPKLLFKKPTKRKQESSNNKQRSDTDNDPSNSTVDTTVSGGKFVGSKLVLQEYVVGQDGAGKPAKKSAINLSSRTAGQVRMSANALRLSHLDEDEDVED